MAGPQASIDSSQAQRGHFGVVVRSEFGPLQLLQMANHVAVDDLKARWTLLLPTL